MQAGLKRIDAFFCLNGHKFLDNAGRLTQRIPDIVARGRSGRAEGEAVAGKGYY